MSESNYTHKEVIAVRYGTLETRRSAVFFEFDTFGENDAPTTMDYYFWVIREAGRTIVVDTGFSAEAAATRGRTMLVTPAAALARLGVDCEAVSQLIITHCHFDHTGNIDLFPNAEIIISADEFDFVRGPFADRPALARPLDPKDIAYLIELKKQGRVRQVEDGYDLGNGISLLLMPGHSVGQLSIVVAQPDGREVFLTSDAVHYYEELELDRPFHVMSSLYDMYCSLEAIRERRARPETVFVPAHDPAVMENFPPYDPASPGLAALVS